METNTEVIEATPVEGAMVVAPESNEPTALTFADNPDLYMNTYATIGGKLQHFVKSKGLSVPLKGRDYPQVEAWTFLYTAMGCHIEEGKVAYDEANQWFEAEVFLVDNKSKEQRGRATAICGDPTDGHWHKAARHNARSMAITRAIGKVGRENFPWMMKIAGLEPTPAEEMPAPVFDVTDLEQQRGLADHLKKQKIDEAKWEKIGLLLDGRVKNTRNINDVIERASKI